MRRASIMVVVLCLVAASGAEAQRFTITPRGRTVFIDDVIVIDIPTESSGWSLHMSDANTAVNLEPSVDYVGGGSELHVRIVLRPALPGPASFGPIDFFRPEGGKPAARLPKLEFDIVPSPDDGLAPVGETFALQRRNNRTPVVVRAEVSGEQRVGRPFLLRYYLYSEKRVNVTRMPELSVTGGKLFRNYDSPEGQEWVSVGGTLAMKTKIYDAIVMPEGPGVIASAPKWVELLVNPETEMKWGPSVTRRALVLPPVTIAPRANDALSSGAFEIECPTSADRMGEHKAYARLVIKGDGELSTAKLRLTGPSVIPVVIRQPTFTEPRMVKGRVETRATFGLLATPLASDATEVAYPAIGFDYVDPASGKKLTISCRATVLSVNRSQSVEASRAREVTQPREAPPEALVVFYVMEFAAALFVLATTLGLIRAIRRP